jgi:hypothetical protein
MEDGGWRMEDGECVDTSGSRARGRCVSNKIHT